MFDVPLRAYFIIQVRTVETAQKYSRVFHPKGLHDVRLYFRCRSGGKRNDWLAAEALNTFFDGAVVRSEIMAPLRDTMRFIDGEKAQLDAGEKLDVCFFV